MRCDAMAAGSRGVFFSASGSSGGSGGAPGQSSAMPARPCAPMPAPWVKGHGAAPTVHGHGLGSAGAAVWQFRSARSTDGRLVSEQPGAGRWKGEAGVERAGGRRARREREDRRASEPASQRAPAGSSRARMADGRSSDSSTLARRFRALVSGRVGAWASVPECARASG